MDAHQRKVLVESPNESHLQPMEAQTKTLAEPYDQGTAFETALGPLNLAGYRRTEE